MTELGASRKIAFDRCPVASTPREVPQKVYAMFGSLGWSEILFVFIIALIIFGPRKLPELGKSLGQSLAQFKRASEDFKRSWEEEVDLEKEKLSRTTAPPETVESIIADARSGMGDGGNSPGAGETAAGSEGSATSSQPAERWL